MKSFLVILSLVVLAVVSNSNPVQKRSFVSDGCGGVSPLTRWARTGRSDTIQMNIDTSHCQFESTPTYFTSISGTAGHYLLVGINAIYEASPNCFLINVRSIDNQTADTLMAWSAEYQWNVHWYGLPS